MDWDKASAELDKPMDEENVAKRTGGGGKELSYIEGWWAIAEANRIFGHGGWSRQTVELRLVSEKPIIYFAKVRVTVGEVIREGCGCGFHDHEKGIKEAETDAMKRALMTFGWPLGLALYDTTKAMVSPSNGKVEQPDLGSIKGEGPSRHASNTPYAHLEKEMLRNDNPPDLNLWWVQNRPSREKQLNSEHRWFLFKSMIQHGLDKAYDLTEQKDFWISHKTELEELKKRNASEYGGLEMYKEKVKKVVA